MLVTPKSSDNKKRQFKKQRSVSPLTGLSRRSSLTNVVARGNQASFILGINCF